ncbi:PREDICTED: B-cell scaffold protein with ankyrin repeats-like [Hipposideros armiger]|uniref:B-cell scaffold protein with ankyrin repeats n=1 Tax=Hipposideros armiger TaxID=186990 RepID=A0A8B7SU64_HIPAR|nr:PREDICTED: B-cell scaffold protein with ankyrin repeats-like [Hipposideros armiger]
MLPAAPGRAGGSRERPPGDPVSPENTKDIVMMYEEDAEEWALYLREVFLHVVKSEAILLYRLENYSLRDLERLSLNSYKCKLLILSDSLLKDLTPKKCQFLEKVLHSPESVVTLLCGVNSSDQLYKLLNIRGGSWEISTEQGPEDYISVIESIVFRGSEDYVQFDIPIDLRVEHPGELSERVETEELSETSRSTIPLAMVLPTEIPCENPGEIFIILRDEVIGTVEVEFTSNNKCIRIQPALWNKTAWCMKALDFPAGPINVNVYCDGVIKATTEIKYYTTEKAMERPGVAGPGDDVPQNDIEEFDDILTSIFKQEIPCYEFRSLQTEIYPQKESFQTVSQTLTWEMSHDPTTFPQIDNVGLEEAEQLDSGHTALSNWLTACATCAPSCKCVEQLPNDGSPDGIFMRPGVDFAVHYVKEAASHIA